MIAKDFSAYLFIIVALVCGFGMLLICLLFDTAWYMYLASLIFLIPAVFVIFFFRDPERKTGPGVISPADGKVIIIDSKKKTRRVAIFMSPLNVHVNRIPFSGTVIETDHHDGGYVPAMNKESENNERYTTVIETDRGNIKVVQIAGAVAKRIVPYVENGDRVRKGDKLGHIAFGSRVDIYFPKKWPLLVEEGQKVTAGVTTIADPPEPKKNKKK